jgi:general secretion pathway protein G
MILRPTLLRSARRAARRAFTLMEVLVVVAIIFILASVSTVVVFRYLDESRERIAKSGVKTLETAVNAYKITHGDYPPNLQVLTVASDGKPAPLAAEALIDPWQREYVYEPQNINPNTAVPRIYSLGANPGNPQGVISNW